MQRYLSIIFILFFIVFGFQNVNFPTETQVPISSDVSKTEQISIPLLLNYQGKLTDNVGNPVRDSSYSITFRLYTTPTGGTAFWEETQTIQTRAGLFHTLLGSVNPITSLPLDGNCYLEMQVNPNPAMSPRIRVVSSAYSYIAKRADTANYAQNASIQRPITPPISTNEISDNAITSIKIQDGTILGGDLNQMGALTGQVLKWTGTSWAPANDSAGGLPSGPAGGDLTGNYPNPVIANNAVNSAKILDGTITRLDVASNFKAPYADTADYVRYAPASVDSARVAGNAHKLQGKDTSYFAPMNHTHSYVDSCGGANRVGGLNLAGLDSRFINENQTAGGDLTGNYPSPIIANNAVTSAKILDGAIQTADIADNAITSAKILNGTIVGADLSQMGATIGQVLKWTGTSWAPANDTFDNAWVRGAQDSVLYTIRQLGIARGGANNILYGTYRHTHVNLGVACTTGTSGYNYEDCTVGGGSRNRAGFTGATVSGGFRNTASNFGTTVGGGVDNKASGQYATVAGGLGNSATGYLAVVGGGEDNVASGLWSAIAGGYADTSAGDYSFTTNNYSKVPSSYSNSAAFNSQTATASTQLRCGILSKAGGSFTIDHPLDPYNKILNHYFVEGPEMLNIYRGSVILDANGRAEVRLPDYFSALNRNPHIQLTGVGTFEVYVLEDVKDNKFVIGGKPGVKVYWVVMGERQDVSAEVIRRLMPVEQEKTGELRGRMLDDNFLCGCMEQLEREGKANGINFRTAEGRKRYEDMKRLIREAKMKKNFERLEKKNE